jgi:hypothetical protein
MKTIEVTVTNMSTEETQTFIGISPQEAVKIAHCQSKGNWNTWSYSNDPEPVYPGRFHWFCGNFAARRDHEGERLKERQ